MVWAWTAGFILAFKLGQPTCHVCRANYSYSRSVLIEQHKSVRVYLGTIAEGFSPLGLQPWHACHGYGLMLTWPFGWAWCAGHHHLHALDARRLHQPLDRQVGAYS